MSGCQQAVARNEMLTQQWVGTNPQEATSAHSVLLSSLPLIFSTWFCLWFDFMSLSHGVIKFDIDQ